MLFAMTLRTQIPSGKNQVRQGFMKPSTRFPKGRVFRYPDKRFEAWREAVSEDLLVQQEDAIWGTLPITVPVHLKAVYLPQDNRTRDLAGMLDALGHLCEYCKILEDDAQIVELSWILAGPRVSDAACLRLEFHQWPLPARVTDQ